MASTGEIILGLITLIIMLLFMTDKIQLPKINVSGENGKYVILIGGIAIFIVVVIMALAGC